MAATVKRKGKQDGNWERRAAIERLCGSGNDAMLEVDGLELKFDRFDNFDYYLVNTDEFAPLAAKSTILEVWTSDLDLAPGDPVLVAGAQRLELTRYAKRMPGQVLGKVERMEHWPGKTPRHYLN